jgi:hypothetical protein
MKQKRVPKIVITKEDHIKLKIVLDNRSEMLQFLSDSKEQSLDNILDRCIFDAYNHEVIVKNWFYNEWLKKRTEQAI